MAIDQEREGEARSGHENPQQKSESDGFPAESDQAGEVGFKPHSHHGDGKDPGVDLLQDRENLRGNGDQEVQKDHSGECRHEPGEMTGMIPMASFAFPGPEEDHGLQKEDDRKEEGDPGQLENGSGTKGFVGVGKGGPDDLTDLVNGGAGPGSIDGVGQMDETVRKGKKEHGERSENSDSRDREGDLLVLSPDDGVGGDDRRGAADRGPCSEKEGEAVRKPPASTEPDRRPVDGGDDQEVEEKPPKSDGENLVGGKVEPQPDDPKAQESAEGKVDSGFEMAMDREEVPDEDAEEDGQENGAHKQASGQVPGEETSAVSQYGQADGEKDAGQKREDAE